jgi:RNA polymerase sigma-70 factor (ECF subfamily)
MTWGDIASALPSFEGDETSFRRWVFAAARSRLQDAREKSVSVRSTQIGQDDDASPERRAVEAALAHFGTLAPQQADVLLLRALGDLDVAEVAEITGDPLDFMSVAEMAGLHRLRDQGNLAGALDLDRAGPGMER